MEKQINKYILTGGPCAGKTTICEKLFQKGYNITSESAREIIEEESSKKYGVLPWNHDEDFNLFNCMVRKRQIHKEQFATLNIRNNNKLFLDRSLIDICGYSSLRNLQNPQGIEHDIQNAKYSKVFFFEVLPEKLYEVDESRKESYDIALKIQEELLEVYRKSELEIVILKKDLGIEQRFEKVMRNI